MLGHIARLRRHPVKGFTPEPLGEVRLEAGGYFPCDRLYAVERGESGFDPAAPRHVSKWRFTVLANHARLAQLATGYDAESGRLGVSLGGVPLLEAPLFEAQGRGAFAAWLSDFLGDEEEAPLRLIQAGPSHRFNDDAVGYVSLVNLDSLGELSARLGTPVDPSRMRANLYVDGWGAWAERELRAGEMLRLGEAVCEVIKPIPRCVAVHVDPATGVRDLDLVGALRSHYGHADCGLYLRVQLGGRVAAGDVARLD